jgi:hypothetical protein
MKPQNRSASCLRASIIAALLVFVTASSCGNSSDDVVKCPELIPLGSRSACDYPETPIGQRYEYGCGYSLPCGESITCICVPDDRSWACNVDCADGGPRGACGFSASAYACSRCDSASSIQTCIDQQSKLVWHS